MHTLRIMQNVKKGLYLSVTSRWAVRTHAVVNKLRSEVILDLIFGNNAGMINKVGVEKH